MTEMRVDIKASVKLISAKLFHSPSHSTDPEPMIVSGTTAYGWAHYSSVDPVKPAPGFRWHVEIKAADGRKLVGSPQYC